MPARGRMSFLSRTVSAAVMVAALSVPAYAQLAENAAPEVAPETAEGEEIVVTGLKRDQSYIDAPVAVQVFNQKAIEEAGITSPSDFLNVTPNVTFIQSNFPGESFVNIRGQAAARRGESSVAFVIDGVQLPTQDGFNGDLFDLKQIEVLKGPQGTIYGRNAVAGAVVISTEDPTEELSGKAFASYGNWNSVKANLAIGGALIPHTLYFRAAGSFVDTDGPFTNIVTGEKPRRSTQKSGRVRLDWVASDKLKFDLRASARRFTGGGVDFNAQIAGSVVGGVAVPRVDTNQVLPFVTDVPGNYYGDKKDVSLKGTLDLGFAELTSVTAWAKNTDLIQGKNFPYADYLDSRNQFGPFALLFGDMTQKQRFANESFSQEFRLTSQNDSRLKWQVGVYYLNNKRRDTTEFGLNGRPQLNPDGSVVPPLSLLPDGTLVRTLQGGGVILPGYGRIHGVNTVNPTVNFDDNLFRAENIAPFANAQYEITDNLTLSVAGRYDIEKRKITNIAPDVPNAVTGAPTRNLCVLATGMQQSECRDKATFKKFQPKVSLIYTLGRTGSLFVSYGEGFKSGGFNPIGTRAQLLLVPGTNPNDIFLQDVYGPEQTKAYEVGFKSQLFDRRLTFNGSVFQTDVTGAQQSEFFPTTGVQAISYIDKVRVRGFEFDFQARATDTLTLFGGYGYIDSKIRELRSAPQFVGNRTQNTAKYNLVAGAQLVQPLSDMFTLLGRAEYTRQGSMWFDASNLPGSKRDPIDLVDARLGLEYDDRLTVSLWSKNLFDKQYNQDAVPLVAILQAVHRAQDRSFGVDVTMKF